MDNKIKCRIGIHIFFFVLFSAVTIFVSIYDVGIEFLKHSDIPNHFFGGVVMGGIPLFILVLPRIRSKGIKIVITILYLPLIGFGWELFEIIVFELGWFPGTLFEETAENKILDLASGLLGFLSTSYLVLEMRTRDLYRAGKYKLS
ncbi:hypothetical protein KAT63_01395 [Candidatus Parcubacteria bacterium]|nr:hypothetical protein [Candidatus Parcubacteria bacterium]